MPGTEPMFVAPSSVADVIGELHMPGALLVGGGTSIALMLRVGLIEPARYVALHRVSGLSGITVEESRIVIGATTTLRELSRDSFVLAIAPSLADAASKVGNPRVRAVATLGGAICHGDPRQDVPPVLLSLGASVRVKGADAEREIPIAEFYTGFMESLLGEDELVTAVLVPRTQGLIAHYERFTPNSADDYPTVSVAVALERDNSGAVTRATLALGGVDATAVVAREAGALLLGAPLEPTRIAAAGELAAQCCDPTSDNRGSTEYKRAMVNVVLRRSLEALSA